MTRSAMAACLAVLAMVIGSGCREAAPTTVDVKVVQVGFDATVGTPVVVLEAGDTRRLPIWIGPAEAEAIARELQGVTPPRPLTHDLVIDLLGSMHAELKRVRITELREGTFYAVLEVDRGGGTVEVDCRPSDAIALALRAGCPIVVSHDLLHRARPDAPGGRGSNVQATRVWTVDKISSHVIAVNASWMTESLSQSVALRSWLGRS